MAYKTLIFGTDDLYPKLKSLYEQEVQRGNLEIVATAELENGKINFAYTDGKQRGIDELAGLDIAIVSSKQDFYNRMKMLESMGFPRNRIIDGRVFKILDLNFSRVLNEGVACGVLEKENFIAKSQSIYPQIYENKNKNTKLTLGEKSYIGKNLVIEGKGIVSIGKFSSLSWNIIFALGQNTTHNYQNVHSTGVDNIDWQVPKSFLPPRGKCKLLIGNDVWIGRGCILKCTNPNKPLVIGDGAIIASDSVIVKNVPPYAIVGGNPAQIIKYRFPEHVIEALLRIKWWDWSLDKIHDNFEYFNDVEKFILLYDK